MILKIDLSYVNPGHFLISCWGHLLSPYTQKLILKKELPYGTCSFPIHFISLDKKEDKAIPLTGRRGP
jgi:hypothetical protein